MNLIKRISLFILINIAVVLTISCLLNVFRVGPYLNAYGLDITTLAIFCLIWGFVGSFISLGLSRVMAKWLMNVQIIDETTCDVNSKFILDMVQKISSEAGLKHTPQVGIYESNEVNAFATGPTQKRSLVAVSTGLLNRMSKDEIEGILGHEISHINNGDMITMTLLQGIVNSFVMFLARILAFFVSSIGKDKEKSSHGTNYFLVYIFEIIFMIIGSMILAFYSRRREYRADEGSANILGKEKMIKALQSLKAMHEIKDVKTEHPAFQTLKISNNSKGGIVNLFSTHPLLDDRIERLQNL